ncbi:MAG TPA: hypothetical protein VGG18_01890 [Granulicella sp.]
MRRLVSLVVLLLFTVPFGLSVTGCSKSTPAQFCNGADSGPLVGQVASISLSPSLATIGESLSYGQIGPQLVATAEDCKGNAVSVTSYTYATSDTSLSYADINPANGEVCAGSWNRLSGGGINDFTTCTAPATTPATNLAYVTATANGTVSNAIPVWTHATVGSVQITSTSAGAPGSAACTANPTSDCCSTALKVSGTPSIYSGASCLSQGTTARLIAKVFDSSGNNITCQVGNLTFTPQAASSVLTIDATGVATANQPGSATVTATIANSGSANTAGFFSTCPPQSIQLIPQGQTAVNNAISVPLNQSQSFTTVITDTTGKQITLSGGLTYASTSPQTVVAGATITPAFPGTATITAICQPSTCNPAPYSQIGLYGNGQPLTSNGIVVNTTATSSTVLYVASTQSQYLYPFDFTTNQQPGLIKLPFIPTSMVISQDGTAIYMGSPQALMTLSTAGNTVTSNTTIVGTVLAVSPDGSTLAVADPNRQTISLITTSGTVSASSTYNATPATDPTTGLALPLRAEWTPDSQTLYITGTVDTSGKAQLLVHSVFNGWLPISITSGKNYTDVAVLVPAVGAYFATNSASTEGRSYCASTTVTAGNPPVTTNSFYPLADVSTADVTRVTATANGQHILGATTTNLSDITLNPAQAEVACPLPTAAQVAPGTNQLSSSLTTYPLSGITASSITGVVPTRNSAVSFVTYNGSSGILPMYIVPSSGTGTVTSVPLSGTAIAPVAGVFDTFDGDFYVGTTGDNLVHSITMAYPASGAPTAVDSGTPLTPGLPCATTGTFGTPFPACASGATTAIPNLIVQRPKKSTT